MSQVAVGISVALPAHANGSAPLSTEVVEAGFPVALSGREGESAPVEHPKLPPSAPQPYSDTPRDVQAAVALHSAFAAPQAEPADPQGEPATAHDPEHSAAHPGVQPASAESKRPADDKADRPDKLVVKRLRSSNWSPEEEVVLVECYRQYASSYESKRVLWDVLSRVFAQKGYDRRPLSLEQKWGNIMQTYRAIKEYGRKKGAEEPEFYDLQPADKRALLAHWKVNNLHQHIFDMVESLPKDKGGYHASGDGRQPLYKTVQPSSVTKGAGPGDAAVSSPTAAAPAPLPPLLPSTSLPAASVPTLAGDSPAGPASAPLCQAGAVAAEGTPVATPATPGVLPSAVAGTPAAGSMFAHTPVVTPHFALLPHMLPMMGSQVLPTPALHVPLSAQPAAVGQKPHGPLDVFPGSPVLVLANLHTTLLRKLSELDRVISKTPVSDTERLRSFLEVLQLHLGALKNIDLSMQPPNFARSGL